MRAWGTNGRFYTACVGLFVRKVKTASGATAVQIARKRRGVRTIVEHLGSAHTEAELAVLMQVARKTIAAGQQAFGLDALMPAATSVTETPLVTGSRSRLLWEVLGGAYDRIGSVRSATRRSSSSCSRG